MFKLYILNTGEDNNIAHFEDDEHDEERSDTNTPLTTITVLKEPRRKGKVVEVNCDHMAKEVGLLRKAEV